MVRISRNKLNPFVEKRLFDLWYEIAHQLKGKTVFSDLMQDLFTPSERIVIAKRIGLLYLLAKHIDPDIIKSKLKLSKTTIYIYKNLLDQKNSVLYRKINSLLVKEKINSVSEEIFESIFVTPHVYKGHAKMHYEYLKRKEKEKILNE